MGVVALMIQRHQIELEVQKQTLRESRAEVEGGLERYADLYESAFRAVVADLTERKRAENALLATETRYHLLGETVKNLACFALSPEGQVASWSAAAEALKGYSAVEIVGRHFSAFYPPEDRERGTPEHGLEVAAAEGRFEHEGWRIRKDGSRFWARVIIAPVRDAQGRLVSFAKVTEDLSRERAIATRLQMVESAPDGVILLDREGRIVHANPRAATLFGHTREELIGRELDELVRERFRARHRSHRTECARAPGPRPVGSAVTLVSGLRKNGTEFPAEISLTPFEASEGFFIVAFIRDVTEQQSLQRKRRRAADRVARLQSTGAALGGAITLTDVAAVILSTGMDAVGAQTALVARTVENERELEVLSEVGADYLADGAARIPVTDSVRSRSALWLRSPDEIRSQYPDAGLFETNGQRALACLPLISRGEPIGVLRLSFPEARTFDDDERAFLTAFAHQCALALDRAQLYEDALAARDVAERTMLMRDELLAMVGHDLGNPLAAVGLWADYICSVAHAGAETDQVRRGASKIQGAVRQMSALLQDLGDLASLDACHFRIEKQEQDTEQIVSDTVDAFAALCAEKGLSILGNASAQRLFCDPNRVQQVLGNLVGNAIKFTPKGGVITVEAVPCGGDVRFSVADTGPGIPDEAQTHVFERYWRGGQRDFAKGVGLGLFIAKGIVDAHGGKIWVESVVGRGSTFCFTLPAAPGKSRD